MTRAISKAEVIFPAAPMADPVAAADADQRVVDEGQAVAVRHADVVDELERRTADAASESPFEARSTLFFATWAIGIVATTILVGQLVALPVFMALYLLPKHAGWRVALGYAVAGWVFLYVMFDQIIHMVWYSSAIELF